MKFRGAALGLLLCLAMNTPALASTKSGAYYDFFNGVGIALVVGAAMGAIAAYFRLPEGRTVLVAIAFAFGIAVFVDVYWYRVFPRLGGNIFNTSWSNLRGAMILALLAVPLPTFLAFSFTSQIRIAGRDRKDDPKGIGKY